MFVSEALNEIRIELDDALSTRWTDANIITLIKKSVRRLGTILFTNDINVGKKVASITLASGTAAYDLPADFMAEVGVFTSAGVPIPRVNDYQWETMSTSTPANSFYIIRQEDPSAGLTGDPQILFKATPSATGTLKLVYWPRLDSLTVGAGSTLPYQGMFDDMVLEYVTMRCKNIDEMNVNTDAQLLQEMEMKIVAAYGSTAAKKLSARLKTSGSSVA